MKEPKGHTYTDYATCSECDVDWPCKTWQKWTRSKDYRIKELEASVERLGLGYASLRKEQGQLHDRVHRLEILVKGSVPALHDLLKGVTGGTMAIGEDVDYQDFTTHDGRPLRVAGLRDFYCTYSSPDGTTWRNGEFTERTITSP